MAADKTRAVIFFSLYAALLLYVLLWAHFDYVHHRVLSFPLLHALIVFALLYVAARAYLVIGDRLPTSWDTAWVTVDLVIISALVRITGGINSEVALIYFLPLATYSIQRRSRGVVAVGLASVLLYVAATWPAVPDIVYLEKLGTRVFVLLMLTALAAYYARHEIARVEEIAKLREKVGLADYRARLSQEMHDGLQHYLLSMGMRLEIARKVAETDPARAARMAVDLRFTIRQASSELRYLVRRLRSPMIEKAGFVDGLRDHLTMFTERSAIAAALEIEGDPTPLPADVEQAAFRIVQEALTNVEKHGQADEVKVSLGFGGGVLAGAVEDDGVGFDPSQGSDVPDIAGGFGLPSMKERAETLGGQLHITSSPGQGTTVAFDIPVPDEQTGEDA